MDKNKYEPVARDHETFLQKAMKRKAFRQAYEDLTEEYALVRELLAARIKASLMGKDEAFTGQMWMKISAWKVLWPEDRPGKASLLSKNGFKTVRRGAKRLPDMH